jgi:hypothetical protein
MVCERGVVDRRPHRARKLVACIGLVASGIVATADVAAAHQPVIVDENDPWPESGPELVDGTVSYAVYGVIDKPGATRGVSFNLRAGDALEVELLIPNLEPELSSALPHVTVLDPDGEPTDPPVALGSVFDEPFSKTSYRRLALVQTTASKSGRYGAVISNTVPGRFTVAIGTRETRGEVRRNDARGSVGEWYATAPPAVPETTIAVTTTIATTTVPATTVPATTALTTTVPALATTAAPATATSTKSKRGTVPWALGAAVLASVLVALVARRLRRRRALSA